MRELDSIAVVGAGRLGTALAAALRASGLHVRGPLRRGEPAGAATAVLLCVPDAEIAAAAAAIEPGPLVGHCSGATGLDVLGRHEAFGLHPLMTVPAGAGPAVFAGAGAAVAGSSPRALAAAAALARAAGLIPTEVAEEDRAAYHAAACMASNYLVALEDAAERVARTAGVERDKLVPLVRATVENWAANGRSALTGPAARKDEGTLARHREVLRERAPDLIPMYDLMATAC